MPSPLHENLIEVLRARPELVAELLSGALGVVLPEHENVRADPADLPDLVPTEYRADAVAVLTRSGTPVLAVVVEVQLARDADKRWSWPVYVATLRARLRCPVELLVMCSDAKVAAWCGAPIDLGASGSQVVPHAMSLDMVPLVTDAEAGRMPERAVLSAIAHGGGEHRSAVLHALLRALVNVDRERRGLYVGLVHSALPEAARRYLEETMTIHTEFGKFSPRQYFLHVSEARGRAAGEARTVLVVLEARGIAVSDAQRELITQCADIDQLDEWVRRAVTASTAEDLFG